MGSLVLAVAAAGVAVSPGLRHELRMSATRVDPGFIELYLTDEGLARACLRTGRTSELSVSVRSHLAEAENLELSAVVGGEATAVGGTLPTRPGEVSQALLRYQAPEEPYDVRVTLAGRPEHVVLQCGKERADEGR
ncbi:hypothetical protein G5C66_04630 [Nocardioides sp. KC13]|uniref:Uncharacterized protein n=1 Tax=Nocardioides turkmenicus TaxID=2711220 RepID=A0A6M1QQP4_9ACTN|nr:hypothetical protein [Nocardioides sp. KC13]NGN92023.1 hypothetical protein [Nocardioides sp. KC13]